MPPSTASCTIWIAVSSSGASPRWWPPNPIAEILTSVCRPKLRRGMGLMALAPWQRLEYLLDADSVWAGCSEGKRIAEDQARLSAGDSVRIKEVKRCAG